jgi:PAS domain S-box-containing protein
MAGPTPMTSLVEAKSADASIIGGHPMKWTIGGKINFGFGTALGFLIIIGIISYRSTIELVDTVHRELHTHTVLSELDDILFHLQNAETGQRGFIITGEEHYLEPYYAAIMNIDRELASLRELTHANPHQQRQLATLEAMIAEKFAELKETVDLRRYEGFEAALRIIRTNRGKEVMDDIRALMNDMDDAGNALLRELDEQAEAHATKTVFVITVWGGLAFGMIALASMIIKRDIAERKRAAEALQQAHNELEVRIRERTAELAEVNEGLKSEISERKRVEAQLAEMLARIEQSHDDLVSILNQLRLGTAMTDKDGRITFISETTQRLLGKSQAEAQGKHWEQVFPFEAQAKAQLMVMFESQAERRTKVPASIEVAGGRHYWMEVDVRDDPRDPRGKIVVLYDMTEIYDLRRLLNDKAQFHDLVGKSEPMQLIYQQIRELAKVDSTVLIEGETGSGKELVARAIHSFSHRSAKPFIAVNCAGLTDSLLGSQLFGHKRGAFTGAIADHQGLFEAANGGTLFLDEIGDIPLNVQTNLLRVLQEKEVTRLGESKPRKIDVRVIVATQHALSEEVAKGRFRADLLYRIRVARVQLPSLAARREDIPLLVAWFLGQCRAATGKSVQNLSHEAMRLLLEYPWPGNVRELKSAIEFAVIHCQGAVIQAEDLPLEIGDVGHVQRSSGDWAHLDEKQRLLAALERAGGKRTVAARLLGISRATLYRRLAGLEIGIDK